MGSSGRDRLLLGRRLLLALAAFIQSVVLEVKHFDTESLETATGRLFIATNTISPPTLNLNRPDAGVHLNVLQTVMVVFVIVHAINVPVLRCTGLNKRPVSRAMG